MKKFNWESMRLRKNKFLRDVFSNFRRKKLKSEKFTIISNNCWGGTIYESYNIKKQSPTVGLFFESSDYIKFITNIKEYLKIELSFIDYNKSKRYKKGLNDNCIVGLLDDIEIYFLHYSSQEEALEKWNRRITRINYDKILFKFNDQNGCTKQNVVDFLKLPYKNKIFFTVNNYNIKDDRIIVLKKIKGQNNVMASQEPFGKSKYIDVTDLINNL